MPVAQVVGAPGTESPVPASVRVPAVTATTGGAPCLTYVQEPAFNLQQQLGPFNGPFAVNLLGNYPLCPNTAVPPALAINPATLAEQFWRTIPLPVPKPSIPPGYAITGKTAYLVTNGMTHPAPYAENTPLGELTVTAAGTYTVDWGDGASSGPFAADSSGYPSGTITHTYEDTGTLSVVVTEQWTATWTIGGAHGVLGNLRTTATIPDFAVQQIQAVISQ